MTEFTKQKIGFALALLGVLFAIHPMLEPYAAAGFTVLGLFCGLLEFHAIVSVLMAFSVYFYALALVSQNYYTRLETVANYCYAAGLILVPCYLAVFVLISGLEWLFARLHIALQTTLVTLVLAGAALAVALWVGRRLKQKLAEKDRVAAAEQLNSMEVDALRKASELYRSGHYDVSVLELWKGVQARLEAELMARKVSVDSSNVEGIVQAAMAHGVIKEASLPRLSELVRIWTLAHTSQALSKDDARAAMQAARAVLGAISHQAAGNAYLTSLNQLATSIETMTRASLLVQPDARDAPKR